MKKILPLLVVGILVLSGLGAIAFPIEETEKPFDSWEIVQSDTSVRDDELDQYQTDMNGAVLVGVFSPDYPNYYTAQSFIPTKGILTRIEILIGKNSATTYPYILAIREELTGENIAIDSVEAEEIVIFEDTSWIEFDFNSVPVTIGQTYYMVSYTANVSANFYVWGANYNDPYPNGSMYFSINGDEPWNDTYSFIDMCFKTYGTDAAELEIESISGGIGVTVTINNTGVIDAEDVECEIHVEGGILGLINKTVNCTIDIEAGELQTVSTGILFGLGGIDITVTVADEEEMAEGTQILILTLVYRVK